MEVRYRHRDRPEHQQTSEERLRVKSVVVVSGGMDSVTLAHWLKHEGHDVRLVSFDYGQRHRKELSFAQQCARDLHARHDIIDLTNITRLISRSALTSNDIEVPDGHYAEDTMKQTIVPNRNSIMASIAIGVAVNEEADHVALGIHAGDHYIYPDCRPTFATTLEQHAKVANQGFLPDHFTILTPFVELTKGDIVARGATVGVQYERTWSCYKGGDVHCGACGTCFERREAFDEACVVDPTNYVTRPNYHDPREHHATLLELRTVDDDDQSMP
jgi:7-cyano-7-deazaguanine synthase